MEKQFIQKPLSRGQKILNLINMNYSNYCGSELDNIVQENYKIVTNQPDQLLNEDYESDEPTYVDLQPCSSNYFILNAASTSHDSFIIPMVKTNHLTSDEWNTSNNSTQSIRTDFMSNYPQDSADRRMRGENTSDKNNQDEGIAIQNNEVVIEAHKGYTNSQNKKRKNYIHKRRNNEN